jgi:GH15 family glucan-1,4-alpha-glucosidase
MGIGNNAEVRDLTGIYDTNDLPETRIDKGLEYGNGELYAITFKNDWETDTNHPLYKKAEMYVHYVAAYWILDRYGGYADKADRYRQRCMEMAAEIDKQYNQYVLQNEAGGSTTSKFSVVASKYKTYPLNPDGEIHKSSVIIPGD